MAWDPIRKWIHRRPLMLLAACLVSGVVIGLQNAVPWWIWAAVLAAAAVSGLRLRRSVFLFASALPLGALMISLALIKPAVLPQDDVVLTGRLVSEPTVKEEYTRVALDSAKANGTSIPCRVMLYLYGSDLPPLTYGAEISVPADTYLPSDHANPYSDSYTAYLWQKGVALCASASADDLTVTAPPAFSLTGLSIKCRLYLQSVVDSIYSKEAAPLVTALLLGDRSMLPDELYENFKIAGLAHILAISGMHITCLAYALDYLLRKARCPEKACFLLVTLFLTVYASVIGFPASVCRAVLMYVLSAGARLFGRPSDGLTGLSLALILLLVINPLSIADLSLILSFTSVAGLMIFTRLLVPKAVFSIRGVLKQPVVWVVTALTASLAAQLGALPAMACAFGTLSTYSLLANLPALPLMAASLPAAMLSVAAGCLSRAAGQTLAFLVGYPLRALTAFTNAVAALPGAVVDTPVWPTALILVYFAVCVLISPVSAIRRRFKQLLICTLPVIACSALLLPMTFPTSGLEVLFLDVGQADASVVRAEERYYLVDVGENSAMADYLSASGLRPAGIFLSHPHIDHVGGLADVIELCPPAVLYLPCLWNGVPADDGVPELIAAAEEAGWIIRFMQAGDTLRLSDHVTAEIHQPFPGQTDDGNASSLVMSVHFGRSSVLFTGDLPTEYELTLFPDCDVLKVAHHGAKSSTSRLFLKMTSPSAAVISVGHNSYGHPADETLARLSEAGVSVYRTDLHGAVSALLDAEGNVTITPMQTDFQPEAVS